MQSPAKKVVLPLLGGIALLNLARAQGSCNPSPCGSNTRCEVMNGIPTCSCLRGYDGNPLMGCQKGECAENSDCGASKFCSGTHCVDSCAGVCGVNAQCQPRNHIPVCSCPVGYTGDPFVSCRRLTEGELCNPSPCGTNTDCQVRNGIPTCSCLRGHDGNPLTGCQKGECADNGDCGPSETCRKTQCVDVCTLGMCGENARCFPRDHVPVCSCPVGYTGNPFTLCRRDSPAQHPTHGTDPCIPSPCGPNAQCIVRNKSYTCVCLPGYTGSAFKGCRSASRHECDSDNDCSDSQKCSNYKCVSACQAGSCASNARCDASNHRAVCTCPRDMTGDPSVSCRPFFPQDVCDPNPCGQNAKCTPGYGRSGKEKPVCNCLPGYIGQPLQGCRHECDSDNDCSDSKKCSNYKCVAACQVGSCAPNARCDASNHRAVCTCPRDMTGDPLVSCQPFVPQDVCDPNPCGQNAKCTPGSDRRGKERPVCNCLPGYIGDPFISCRRGECQSNSECPDDKSCQSNVCKPVCTAGACNAGAECRPRDHRPVCNYKNSINKVY